MGAIDSIDGSGDDHGGQAGRSCLARRTSSLPSICGMRRVAEEEVDGAGERLLEDLERVLRGLRGEDMVAAGVEEEGTNGEDLFVVVDAEDGFSWAQSYSRFCRTPPCGGLAADGLKQHVCWLAVCRP